MLDRFHIMSHFSQAIDEVRAAEARKLAAEGRAPLLKHSRWLLLKRPENLTDGQAERLAELVRRNLRTVRAYLLKEDFQSLWGYVSPYWAGRFLDRWCTRTMRSRLPQWTGQNRPFVGASKPAISGGPRLELRSTSRRPLLARCLPAR